MDRERTAPGGRWGWRGVDARDMTDAWGEWASGIADAFESLVGTIAPEEPAGERRRRHRPHRKHRTTCGDCRPDRCHCECCVYDADLVVYGRVGEQRVVPIRISNERARTRDISLELSAFTTSSGRSAPVQGKIITPTRFTLEACEREDAVLVIEVGGLVVKDPDSEEGTRLGDVDDCLVVYADLRIQGCDVRPVRIAVALLPRDCDAYEVHCACGCC